MPRRLSNSQIHHGNAGEELNPGYNMTNTDGRAKQIFNLKRSAAEACIPMEVNPQLIAHMDTCQRDQLYGASSIAYAPVIQPQEVKLPLDLSIGRTIPSNAIFSRASIHQIAGSYNARQNILPYDITNMLDLAGNENSHTVVDPPLCNKGDKFTSASIGPDGEDTDRYTMPHLTDLIDFDSTLYDVIRTSPIRMRLFVPIEDIFRMNSIFLYGTSALLLARCVRWRRVVMEYTYDYTDRTGRSLASMRISKHTSNIVTTPEKFSELIERIDAYRRELQCYIVRTHLKIISLLSASQPLSGIFDRIGGQLISITELETIITQESNKIRENYSEILESIPPLAEVLATAHPRPSACLMLIYKHALLFEKLYLGMLNLSKELAVKYSTLESALNRKLEAMLAQRNMINISRINFKNVAAKIYTPEELENWTKGKAEEILRLCYIIANYTPADTIGSAKGLKAFKIWNGAERKPDSSK